jgi:hypothetical protein
MHKVPVTPLAAPIHETRLRELGNQLR